MLCYAWRPQNNQKLLEDFAMPRGGKRPGAGRKPGSPNRIGKTTFTEALRILKDPRTKPERRDRIARAAAAILQAAELGSEPKPAPGSKV
jgi:hypothetical protein